MVSFCVNGHDFTTFGHWHVPEKWSEGQAWQSSRSVWAALSGTCCHERAVTLVDGPVQGQKLDFDLCGSLSAQHILLVHESVIISEEN